MVLRNREPTPEPANISLTRVAHSKPDRHPPSRPHPPIHQPRKRETHDVPLDKRLSISVWSSRPPARASHVYGSDHYRGRAKGGRWRSQLPHRPEAAEACIPRRRALASRPLGKRAGVRRRSSDPGPLVVRSAQSGDRRRSRPSARRGCRTTVVKSARPPVSARSSILPISGRGTPFAGASLGAFERGFAPDAGA